MACIYVDFSTVILYLDTLLKFLFFLSFLGLHLRQMEITRLGVQSELHLPAYATATATPDLSCIFDLRYSLWQHWILNTLIEARDQTCVLLDTSRILNLGATMGTPHRAFKGFCFPLKI